MTKKFTKIFASLAAFAFVLFGAQTTLAAPLTTALTVNPGTVNLGGTVTLSGSCGTTAANSTVSFSLSRGTNTVTLGTAPTDATGAFTASEVIPSNFGSGTATITATCPNGATGSVGIAINTTIGTTLNVTPVNPTTGSTITVSGVCGSINTGTITFSVTQNGTTANVATTATATAPDGAFTTNLTLPSTLTTGTATINAICPNGAGTISAPVVISSTTTGVLTVSANPTLGQSATVSGTCGTTGGGNSVSFSVISNGTTTAAGTPVTADSAGNFNSTFTIPTTIASGPATIQALCSNGMVVSTLVSLAPASGTTTPPGTLTVNTSTPIIGTTITATGVCGSAAIGQNVTFGLSRNGVETTITVPTTTAVSPDGSFMANIIIPTSYGTGPATLDAHCGTTGVTLTTALTIDPALVTPIGGVAAGEGGAATGSKLPLALGLISLGLTGAFASRKMKKLG